MVLSEALLRFAAGRPHPLLVSGVGSTEVRLAVERELRRLGWPLATSPAAANLLVTCATDGDDLAPFVERTWAAIGAPRGRVSVTTAANGPAALRHGRSRLESPSQKRARASPAHTHRTPDRTHEHAQQQKQEKQHDHDMGDMEMPAGLPMPERAEDRDGLKLDQLHVPLGPVLAHWPAGLVVHATLQGDVIQHAEVEALTAPTGSDAPFWDEPWLRAAAGGSVQRGAAERRRAAAHLDSLGRLLAVSGWEDAATQAQRLRDDLLAGVPADEAQREAARLARRLHRARALRWLTNGLGVLGRDDAAAAGVTGPALCAAGDVSARWAYWLAETVDAVAGLDDRSPLEPRALDGPRGRLDGKRPPSAALLEVLPGLLEGCELAGARLVVASLDPDLDELRGARWRATGDE